MLINVSNAEFANLVARVYPQRVAVSKLPRQAPPDLASDNNTADATARNHVVGEGQGAHFFVKPLEQSSVRTSDAAPRTTLLMRTIQRTAASPGR